ncbi:hypothetical protein QJS83_08645 [Bdellovibrio sp. 22V]|uniref:hypothetical protein n=1 Tax=Bdellovibrio TaxID=958 RepID=UPI002543F070|nr:hypothetical protein [Bdellovibrio sp. 22V]WII70524.1 hypothetical protein QJS83_08645 [Bdellovibrio sp. 22V]
MKKSLLFYLMMFFLMTVSFQNCAPNAGVQFGIDSQSAYSVYGELPDNAKVVELQPKESTEYPSTQVVLVIDNSATMKQSQEELAERIDSLLATLSNKKVTLHMFSTSQYLYASKSTFGTFKNGVETYVNSAADLSPTETDAIMKSEFGPNTLPFVLNPTDSASVRQAAINRIKQSILVMGISGDDNESGLCGVLQMANRKPLFVNTNEKVVFFVLTDEDNYNGATHCKAEQVFNWDKTQMITYKQTQVSYTFTGVGYRDGVTAVEETRPFVGVGASVINGAASLAGQECHSEDWKVVQSRVNGYIGKTLNLTGVNFYFKDATVTGCQYKEASVLHTFLESEGLIDYCNNSYRGYSNVLTYLAATKTGVSASQPCLLTSQSMARGVIRTKYFLENPTDVASTFLSQINTALQDKYFVSVVMNKEGQSCGLKSGQSYGAIFQRMAELSPSKVQTYSLCQGDDGYKAAFKKIAESISYVSQDFALDVPAGMKIRDVLLFPQGSGSASLQLTPDQYEYRDGRIKINAKLSGTDKLKVIIF